MNNTTPEEEYARLLLNIRDSIVELDRTKARLYAILHELEKFEMKHQHEWVITKVECSKCGEEKN